ncbi:MAG: biopolymer transporter ExbD [Planctomycetota bacterium]|nr:biopolymer transporter ExbD [Planctomycetota bacterium]
MGMGSRIPAEEIKGDMTPMIDVVFQLLIFFMLTIKFKLLEGKLSAYLPKDVGVNDSQAIPKDKIEIKLKVEREGTKLMPDDSGKPWGGEGAYKYGPDRVIKYAVGPKASNDLRDIITRVKDLHKSNPDQSVTIDPLPGTVYGDVVVVVDEVLGVGFSDISFVGDKSALYEKK